MEERVRELEERLVRLERRNRVLQSATVFVTCCIAWVLLVAITGPERPVTQDISVRSLSVVDRENKPRIVLNSSPESPAEIQMLNDRGKPGIRISLDDTGVRDLVFLDDSSASNFSVGIDRDRNSKLYIRGGSHDDFNMITLAAENESGFPEVLVSKAAIGHVHLGIDELGIAGVSVRSGDYYADLNASRKHGAWLSANWGDPQASSGKEFNQVRMGIGSDKEPQVLARKHYEKYFQLPEN